MKHSLRLALLTVPLVLGGPPTALAASHPRPAVVLQHQRGTAMQACHAHPASPSHGITQRRSLQWWHEPDAGELFLGHTARTHTMPVRARHLPRAQWWHEPDAGEVPVTER